MRGWGEGNLREGDAVIISMMEHYVNLATWQQLCKKTGVELRVLETDKDGKIKWKGGEMGEGRRKCRMLGWETLMELLNKKSKIETRK